MQQKLLLMLRAKVCRSCFLCGEAPTFWPSAQPRDANFIFFGSSSRGCSSSLVAIFVRTCSCTYKSIPANILDRLSSSSTMKKQINKKSPEQIAWEKLRKRRATLVKKTSALAKDCGLEICLLIQDKSDTWYEYKTNKDPEWPPKNLVRERHPLYLHSLTMLGPSQPCGARRATASSKNIDDQLCKVRHCGRLVQGGLDLETSRFEAAGATKTTGVTRRT